MSIFSKSLACLSICFVLQRFLIFKPSYYICFVICAFWIMYRNSFYLVIKTFFYIISSKLWSFALYTWTFNPSGVELMYGTRWRSNLLPPYGSTLFLHHLLNRHLITLSCNATSVVYQISTLIRSFSGPPFSWLVDLFFCPFANAALFYFI